MYSYILFVISPRSHATLRFVLKILKYFKGEHYAERTFKNFTILGL